MELSHYDKDGSSRMVDVTNKKITVRSAKARAFISMQKATIEAIEKLELPKGNAFETARIAGILAAKKTSELIPMCHPLLLTYVNVKIDIDKERCGIFFESEIMLEGKTGAEMEALTAVSVAALTMYDMCKAIDKTMKIESVYLVEKKGGKSDIKYQIK